MRICVASEMLLADERMKCRQKGPASKALVKYFKSVSSGFPSAADPVADGWQTSALTGSVFYFPSPICYLVNRRCSLTGKDTRRNKLIDMDDMDIVSPLEMKRLFQSTTRQSSAISIISLDALALDGDVGYKTFE